MSGVPSTYTDEVADEICERLSCGESLKGICSEDDKPNISTVFRWIAANDTFRDMYARAREEQAETLADEIIGISDEECTMVQSSKHPGARSDDDEGNVEVVFNPTAVARNRLRVDARKWVASKLKPRKYGDKMQTELSGPDGGPVQTVTSFRLAPLE